MKAIQIDARGRQMLELLAQGASARVIARKLGYSEGTMRVYLHHLYRAIGVRNKTEAVIWHLNRERPAAVAQASAPVATASPAPTPPAATVASEVSFGDMALHESLDAALGIMGTFVGPYGRLWEVGVKLKGGSIDEKTLVRRAQSRLLWRALLRADYAYAKRLHDDGVADGLADESPTDALLLAALLQLGGYTAAADTLAAKLGGKRKGGLSAREAQLLKSLRGAIDVRDEASIASIHQCATEGNVPVLRQVAMVALFHAYRMRRDLERARQTANAIWSAAEAVRQELEAMGVRSLARDSTVPKPAKHASREAGAAREKATAGR